MCGLGELKDIEGARKQMLTVAYAATRDAEILVEFWAESYFDHIVMRAKCRAIILSAQGVILALSDFIVENGGSNNGFDTYCLEKLMACEKLVNNTIALFGYNKD